MILLPSSNIYEVILAAAYSALLRHGLTERSNCRNITLSSAKTEQRSLVNLVVGEPVL